MGHDGSTSFESQQGQVYYMTRLRAIGQWSGSIRVYLKGPENIKGVTSKTDLNFYKKTMVGRDESCYSAQ